MKHWIENSVVDEGYLTDWYISSVGNETPVWTDEHIEELCRDFYVILKESVSTKDIVVERIPHDVPKFSDMVYRCPDCREPLFTEVYDQTRRIGFSSVLHSNKTPKYCPYCGEEFNLRGVIEP